MGHLPSNPAFFKEYSQSGVFIEVRFVAIEALVDITKAEQRQEDLDFLLDLVEVDAVPAVRQRTLRLLTLNPPFTKKDVSHPLNTEELVERIWRMMNQTLSHDTQLRCALVDLYFMLYGRSRPSVLPKPELSVVLNLKDKIAISNLSEGKNDSSDNHENSDDGSGIKRHSQSDSTRPDKRFKSGEDDESKPQTSGDESQVKLPAEKTVNDAVEAEASSHVVASPEASTSTGFTEEANEKKKEERSHSKPHKEKKKKKKKHKHKHKHKRNHSEKERDDRPSESALEAGDVGFAEGGSTNPSPAASEGSF